MIEPLIPELGKQREMGLSMFKASLLHRSSSKRARAMLRDPVLGEEGEKKRMLELLVFLC